MDSTIPYIQKVHRCLLVYCSGTQILKFQKVCSEITFTSIKTWLLWPTGLYVITKCLASVWFVWGLLGTGCIYTLWGEKHGSVTVWSELDTIAWFLFSFLIYIVQWCPLGWPVSYLVSFSIEPQHFFLCLLVWDVDATVPLCRVQLPLRVLFGYLWVELMGNFSMN